MFSPFFSFGLRFIWKHGGIGRVGHHQLVEKKISRWEKASDFSHAPFPPPLQMYSFPQNANKFPHLLENIQIYFCKYISTSFRQHANIFHFLWTLNQHANLLFSKNIGFPDQRSPSKAYLSMNSQTKIQKWFKHKSTLTISTGSFDSKL